MNLIRSTKREVAGLTSGDGPIAYRKIQMNFLISEENIESGFTL